MTKAIIYFTDNICIVISIGLGPKNQNPWSFKSRHLYLYSAFYNTAAYSDNRKI